MFDNHSIPVFKVISVYKIKPAFQKLLQPVLKALHRAGITANQITVTAIVLSIGIGLCIGYSAAYPALLWAVPLGLLIRMALNALDGMMARQYNMTSKTGEMLNELGDVISDQAIILPLAVLDGVNALQVVVFAALAMLNEFSGLLGKVLSDERRYDGPMGKSDRALVISLFCILAYFIKVEPWSDYFFLACILLVIYSTITRVRKSLK